MAVTIKPEEFSDYMNELLDQYGDEVYSITVSTLKDVSDQAVNELKTAGDFENHRKRGGYRSTWTAELRKFASRFRVSAVIYNKKNYRLTHLLEHGHAIVKRGEVVGKASAKPHIEDVEEWAIKKFEQELADGLSRLSK